MPLLSLCSYPGCRHPVPRGEKYCDKHKGAGTRREQLQKKERWERRFRKKGSSAARGYGARWRRLRERFLSEHPLCEECLERGRAVPATDVDHIRPHRGDEALMWDEENLQALCHACHSRKTAAEDGGFGNATRQKAPIANHGVGGSKVDYTCIQDRAPT